MDPGTKARTFLGPETWTLIREAYLAGAPAPALARRFGVGEQTIRKRATREGWTRRRQAELVEPKATAVGGELPAVPPEQAVAAAIAQASALLSAGRGPEAAATLRAAEALGRLVGRGGDPAPEPEPPAAAHEAEAAAEEEAFELFRTEVMREAERIAHHMLAENAQGCPAGWSREVYRFRARHFGPELAAADYAYGVSKGWGHKVWDEHGNIRPPEPPVTPATWALEQHERCCAWIREHGEQ